MGGGGCLCVESAPSLSQRESARKEAQRESRGWGEDGVLSLRPHWWVIVSQLRPIPTKGNSQLFFFFLCHSHTHSSTHVSRRTALFSWQQWRAWVLYACNYLVRKNTFTLTYCSFTLMPTPPPPPCLFLNLHQVSLIDLCVHLATLLSFDVHKLLLIQDTERVGPFTCVSHGVFPGRLHLHRISGRCVYYSFDGLNYPLYMSCHLVCNMYFYSSIVYEYKYKIQVFMFSI